ncbi:MAG: hypothetical protein A2504_07395 [Bdellovibrionales bacterium RIFOXYD12_FULL_39_22]|nr:MAG: hypothetical protein A2385_16765 [Bdellovibrionales bacterium RIFOXYB1_FULL_39_21]OFZ44702.1 MAG: hypothetical protein A2485_14625 [Bdellovibrionales bacterium RIFOXYC12_FULL_39_17]OFZ49332.1 MAG: hypothetical protein A2404_08920 [Bdellovibrionales bacterium RIFOXYC1_FULL_39_130]OFZ77068.1 MAG: hypothetical protein A2560_09885 [Bdellovibrionales bacterium RIFOXYD1_FULL_39_84]OFZ95328.1 MAG: hypothetical protein A2504_07395 [Bdellovibrionales bacterium RIFOXYD12_FULL_39_22]HLE13055.1 MB
MNGKITILAENYALHTPYAEDGICMLIAVDNKFYLFDTGFTGECALKNIEVMQIKIPQLAGIILSHGHNDHTGGIASIITRFGPCPIYAHPNIFNKTFSVRGKNKEYIGIPFERDYLEKKLKIPFHFSRDFTQIDKNIYMTGTIPMANKYEKIPRHFKISNGSDNIDDFIEDTFEDDNAVVISDPKGLTVLLGCAHRGVINSLEYVQQKLPHKKIHTVIGGTHLKEAGEEHFEFVVDYLKKLELDTFAPGHCTGINNIFKLQNIFGTCLHPAFCGEKF